jgi:phasin
MSANDPFSFSNVTPFQVPEQMRAFAEQGVSQVRDGYQKLKEAAESNNGALEAVYASATKGAGDFATKVIDIAKTNTETAFSFTQSLLGTRSPMEALELINTHARKQFDVLTAQSQDLAALTQKVAAETVEPIKAGAAQAFKPVI